jgi:hypothetical protein
VPGEKRDNAIVIATFEAYIKFLSDARRRGA